MSPYLSLRSGGYRNEYYERILTEYDENGYLNGLEELPFRKLDREHALWKSGWRNTSPQWYQLFKATTLAKKTNPIYLNTIDAYSVTHTLFYLTDFGNQQPPFDEDEKKDCSMLIEYLLIHYMRMGNYDLVGELLIAAECIGVYDVTIYNKALTYFKSAIRTDGAIPCDRDIQVQFNSSNLSSESEVFDNCYHTTLVSLLYEIVSLRITIKLQEDTK